MPCINLDTDIGEHENWIPFGDLTLYDPNDHNPDLGEFVFTEDMFHLTRKDDLFIIDIGWYPDGDRKNGQYTGYVVRNQDWQNPVEQFSSRDQKNVHWWVLLMMGKYDEQS